MFIFSLYLLTSFLFSFQICRSLSGISLLSCLPFTLCPVCSEETKTKMSSALRATRPFGSLFPPSSFSTNAVFICGRWSFSGKWNYFLIVVQKPWGHIPTDLSSSQGPSAYKWHTHTHTVTWSVFTQLIWFPPLSGYSWSSATLTVIMLYAYKSFCGERLCTFPDRNLLKKPSVNSRVNSQHIYPCGEPGTSSQ